MSQGESKAFVRWQSCMCTQHLELMTKLTLNCAADELIYKYNLLLSKKRPRAKAQWQACTMAWGVFRTSFTHGTLNTINTKLIGHAAVGYAPELSLT